MEYPCYDLFGKKIDGGSCHKTLALRPTRMKKIKTRRGHSRAMHWCYKAVDSTLICHFSLAFGLGRSANPPGSIFAVAPVDSSFHAALVLRAHLLHCMGVNSLLLVALRLLKNLGSSPSAPLSTLSRRGCILRFDAVKTSIVEGILCFCQLVLLGDKGGVYASSTHGYQSNYGGCTSFDSPVSYSFFLRFSFHE